LWYWALRRGLGRLSWSDMLSYIDQPLTRVYRWLPQGWRLRIEDLYVSLLSRGIGELRDPRVSVEEAEATRSLSVVVPVHNAPVETRRCLLSLERFAGAAEVILVDDGSTDRMASEIVTDFAQRNDWKAVRHEVGSFHSGACMAGAKLVTRPVMCLLNSDTVVTQNSWSLCVRALLDKDGPIAVVPGMAAGPGSQCDLRAYRCRDGWRDETIFAYAERRRRRFGSCGARRSHGYLGGAALFLRKADWDRVGGFSGCRLHYGNDEDLCRKLVAQGGWLGVCDGAYVHHLGGRSAPR